MDLKDLTAKAELIFVGTVINIRSERQTQTIETYVTFSDLRLLKGSYFAGTIELRLMGGSVAGESVHVYGMPSFVIGEKNLIFLAGNFLNICPIVGWGQGRFKIRWDEAARQEMVFDDSNVPVTEIRGNEILRAKKNKGSQSSAGLSDKGHALVSEVQQPVSQVPLALKNFVSAIETQMGIKR
jgi:hypothetical protein